MKPWMKVVPAMAAYCYLFFLSIDALGGGMKASFKAPVKHYLHENGDTFTELVSFVVGILATSLVQSSSTVTAMAVEMTREGVVPLLISIGIVHGANLGTSVTSSIVAFASEIKAYKGNPLTYAWELMFAPRLPGFHRAVSTAVCHGLFNAMLVTAILLVMELPFGIIHHVSEASATSIATVTSQASWLIEAMEWISPKAYTKPVIKAIMGLGVPGWAMVLGGFGLMFASLKGFSGTMKAALMSGREEADPEEIGALLLGSHPLDTFIRGLVLTILVQSSSATTSMVVPLAALGFFSLRQVFPFIMGANIGTTTTALIVASSSLGTEGFQEGMTIALAHFYLNCLATLIAVIPWVRESVLGATQWLADLAERVPATLVGYLVVMAVVVPSTVYFLPDMVSRVLLAIVTIGMFVGPHLYIRRVGWRDTQPQDASASSSSGPSQAA